MTANNVSSSLKSVTRLQQAIETLEKQRGTLSDDVIDDAILALRTSLTKEQSDAEVTAAERPRLSACLVANLAVSDPEKLPRLLAAGFNLMGEIVREHGGKIRQMRGVYLIALFNSAPDDPVRAAYAVLAMQERFRLFSEELEKSGEGTLMFRAGLNTGVMMSESGKSEAIDMAGILSQRAPPNTVLVSQHMVAYLKNDFVFQPAFALEIGQKQVTTFILREARQTPTRHTESHALEKPFVGRVDELRMVLEQVERLGTGHGSTFVIVGEHGLGKTRLVNEVRRAAAMSQWLEARCNTTPVPLIFGAWNDLLLVACGSHPLESPRLIGKRLQSWLDARLIPQLYPILAAQLGLIKPPTSTQQILRQTTQAWQTLLEAVACQRPLILVFEDIQRIDSASLLLLETLLTATREQPILWLLTTQPLYNEPAAAMLTRLARENGEDFVYLALEPFGESESLALLRGLIRVRELPDPFEEGLLQRASGNPLLMQQIMQAMVDKRGLYRDVRSEWQIAASALREPLPDTLPDVVRLRLGMLTTEEREWLEIAAVAGDALLPGLIAARPDDAKDDHLLNRLSILNFVDEHGQFINTQLAEAIYQQVADQRRQTLHRQVAALIAKHCELNGSWLALLAYHLTSGSQPQSALRTYLELKDWAYTYSALIEATQMIDGMLSLLSKEDNPEQVAQLLIEQTDILAQINPHDERCLTLLEAAYNLWNQLGNAAEAASTLLRQAVYYAGTPREHEFYRQAQALLERDDPQHEMLPGIYLQQALYAAGQGQDSSKLFQRARALALQLQNVDALAHIYFEMGLYLANTRQLETALSAFQKAFSYFAQITDGAPDDKIMTANYLADLLNQLGRPAEGEYYANEAVAGAHTGGDLIQVLPFITLSECCAAQGRWDDAFHALSLAHPKVAPSDLPPRFWQGRWQFEQGDRLNGLEVMRESLPIINLECNMIFIDYLLDANFTQEAVVRMHQIAKDERVKNERTMMPLADFYDRLRGRLAAAENDFSRAISLLNRVMFQFEQKSFVLHTISTRRLLAQVLMARHESGDEEKAHLLLTEALTSCKSLSLHAESRRLQQALHQYWP